MTANTETTAQLEDCLAQGVEADAELASGAAILVVEDEPALRKVLSLMLESMGFSVQLAQDADEARRLLDLNQQFDLVLTDWLMPGEMDGHQLAQWIRDRDPQANVLIATGYSESIADVARTAEFPLLFKPYSRAELQRRVNQALETAG